MATATYIPIATQTLGTAGTSITFSSIPSTYKDLRLTLSGVPSSTTAFCYITLNGDTVTNYSYSYITGSGTAASSSMGNINGGSIPIATKSQTSLFFTVVDFFSYTAAVNKTVIWNAAQDNNGSGTVDFGLGTWRSTAAITTINAFVAIGNLAAGATATLWGI